MTAEFRLLTVITDETCVRATTKGDSLSDSKIQDALFEDFEQLAQISAKPVILDLRSVKFFEGTVPGKLLRLSDALSVAGRSLTVLAAPNICEVLKMLQLDRKFKISDSEQPSDLFKLG